MTTMPRFVRSEVIREPRKPFPTAAVLSFLRINLRPVILTLTTVIGLTFFVVAAFLVAVALGWAVAGLCTLLAGFYYELNSRDTTA